MEKKKITSPNKTKKTNTQIPTTRAANANKMKKKPTEGAPGQDLVQIAPHAIGKGGTASEEDMQCHYCMLIVPKGKYCNQCGAHAAVLPGLEESLQCAACGTSVMYEDDRIYCTKCRKLQQHSAWHHDLFLGQALLAKTRGTT